MAHSKSFGGFPTPNIQTPTVDTVMERLFFLTETQWENARNKINYNLVIIGSGFCALAVAKRALENDPNCRVLIIERGPFFLPTHFQNLGKPFDDMFLGHLETFPWTLSAQTAQGNAGEVRFQQGMIPFFGGRSVTWTAWCPEPTPEEMHEWPEETIQAAKKYFPSAKKLLHVATAAEIAAYSDHSHGEVYGKLQTTIDKLLADKGTQVHNVYHTEAAPMAVDGRYEGIPFAKYSVPAELLSLANKKGNKERLDIVTNCIVEKIYHQHQIATALKTSRGEVALGEAKLVLAMGTLPPTTLIINSFPHVDDAGKRFGAHFISAIVARVPREDIPNSNDFATLELGAFYIAGTANGGDDFRQQFHVQLTAISNGNPEQNAKKALRYMPDVVATASREQLRMCKDHVLFVCAVLGELDVANADNWFLKNEDDTDLTTNSLLQVVINEEDKKTWNAMDDATFGILEEILSPEGSKRVEYWNPDIGTFTSQRPSEKERRVDMLVHECSTLHIGEEETSLVDTNYCLRGTSNVYVTGGALWPRSASWNPTLTMVALAQHLADQLVTKTKPTELSH